MKVLSFVSRKGGSGKTTLAACIAVAAAQAGLRVATIDLDPQRSLSAWGRRREAEDMTHHATAPALFQSLLSSLRSARRTDLAIVDSAGVADTGAALAATAANLTIVPIKPTQLDIDAATETLATLRSLKADFAAVLVQIPTGTAAERARDAASAVIKLGRTCPRLIASRLAYVDAIGMGLGVTDFDPRSKAAQEIDDLWVWIAKELSIAPP